MRTVFPCHVTKRALGGVIFTLPYVFRIWGTVVIQFKLKSRITGSEGYVAHGAWSDNSRFFILGHTACRVARGASVKRALGGA
jgi:hypothetical protein